MQEKQNAFDLNILFIERVIRMKYTTLLFDIDNTILDFDKDEHTAVTATLKECNLPYDEETVKLYSYFNSLMWKKYEKGLATKADIQNTRFKLLTDHLGIKTEISAGKINELYEINLRKGGTPAKGAKELLQKLKNSGYRLYAVTNGLKLSQENRGRNSGINVFFEDVFISECIGFSKPKKEYFDYVFSHIEETDKSKILLIGDSLTSDITGAFNAQIDCVWLNRKNEENTLSKDPQYIISDISNLQSILL